MAINVNTVYQTVLLILNKEQRGYMTPVEFNKIGAQVQLEIFETYFDSLNQQIRVPQTNTDYADRVVNLEQKMQIFKTSGQATYANGVFNLPVTQGGSLTWIATASGATTYPITSISAADLADGVSTVSVNSVIRPASDYTINGLNLTWNNNAPRGTIATTVLANATPPNKTVTSLIVIPQPDILVGSYITGPTITASPGGAADTVTIVQNGQQFGVGVNQSFITDTPQTITAGDAITFFNTITISTTPATSSNFYRLGTVLYTAGSRLQELQKVDRGEFYTLNLSPLTKPTTSFPIYLFENNQLTVYPNTIQSGVSVDYIRKPNNPVWSFTSTAVNNYAYVYDNDTSSNFELHPSEQTEVILRTLLYAGVVIKDPQIIQVAAQQVAQENQNQQR
jgi:hypothetical protein